jgi:hypothetical protein
MDIFAPENLQPLLMLIFTIPAWSILIKYNKYFKMVQYTMVGLAVGHFANVGFNYLNKSVLTPLFAGRLLNIIPIILGLLIYTSLTEKYRSWATYGTTVIIAAGSGVAVVGAIKGQFLGQLVSTMKLKPLNTLDGINSVIMLIMVIAAISYFTFSREHKGALGYSAKLGRYVLMAAFGGQFAGSLMVRSGGFTQVIQDIVLFIYRVFGIGG